MAKITYIEHSGTEHIVEVESGRSLMEGATGNMVPGILADCGGACACATCHVIVADEWAEIVGPAAELEEGMLDIVEDRRPTSRLSCQIKIDDRLDGLVVRLPEVQG